MVRLQRVAERALALLNQRALLREAGKQVLNVRLRVLKKRVLLQVCGEAVLQLTALLGRILRAGREIMGR